MKFRDERRPRFGVMRAREFLMKDAYSFDRDEDGLARSYDVMVEAYRAVFDRCGLRYVIVEADAGLIGGSVNHEFMAPAEVGEDLFVSCSNGDYAADLEAASAQPPEEIAPPALEPMTEVSTPGCPGIQDVVDLLGRPASEMLKCMLHLAGEQVVAVLLPGDREVNEHKLARALGVGAVRLFEPEDFERHGLVKGYVGPQGLGDDVLVVADLTVRAGANWVTGANRVDHHVTGANRDRDFRIDRFEDVSRVRDGDPCPRCGGVLRIGRSIVVGHTYQLGTKYAVPLKATFVDEDGTEQPYVMGCYGIGLTRILAAAAEQFNDDAGLFLPKALAPFAAVLIPTNMDQAAVVEAAEGIYGELGSLGLEVVLDDREVSAGVKFADADLIGYPVQAVIGKRGIEAGTVDLKLRATGERSQAPLADAASAVRNLFDAAP